MSVAGLHLCFIAMSEKVIFYCLFMVACCKKYLNLILLIVHMIKVCTGFFNTLANRTRLNILYALKDGVKSVNEIVTETGFEQSLVSHNLRLLKECHFVESKVEGKRRLYSLNKDTIVPLFALVDKHQQHFCRDDACYHNLGKQSASK